MQAKIAIDWFLNRINELLKEVSPKEKMAIAMLAIDYWIPPVRASISDGCSELVIEAYRHLGLIGDTHRAAIAIAILSELAPSNEDEDDGDEEDDDDIDDRHIAAALEAGDINKAFSIAAALDKERDLAAFRAEARAEAIAASH